MNLILREIYIYIYVYLNHNRLTYIIKYTLRHIINDEKKEIKINTYIIINQKFIQLDLRLSVLNKCSVSFTSSRITSMWLNRNNVAPLSRSFFLSLSLSLFNMNPAILQ